MEIGKLKKYVDYLLEYNIDKDTGENMIKSDTNLNDEEKYLINCYVYPRKLLDRELPTRIFNEYGGNYINLVNKSRAVPVDYKLSSLIVESYRTAQYGRFIRHLMHSFLDKIESTSPIKGEEVESCAICGRSLYEFDIWEKKTANNPNLASEIVEKNYLAFGNTDTEIVLCKNCIKHLKVAYDIIDCFEPNFLHKFNKRNEK